MKPLPLSQVRITGGLLAERQRVNREVTLSIEYRQLEKTSRLGAWRFDWKPGQPNQPHFFWDSDIAKWIEAASYSLVHDPDPALQRQVENAIALLEKAPRPDGYVNSHYTVVEPENRWTNLRDKHELYGIGHLMEAAVAWHEATGRDDLLRIMAECADHVRSVFGRGKGKKRGYPGHEEIELALVKMYRSTGSADYLDLARYFVDERGRKPYYFDQEARKRGEDPAKYRFGDYSYCQAHKPVREQDQVTGHAVRGMYLYSAMADLALETKDRELALACRRIWKDLTDHHLYVTGGIGQTCRNEGYTTPYDLPNETAYAETCAAIGLAFWAHRMLRLDLDGKYADVMERALYNGVLSGVSQDGRRFFYANPLAAWPDLPPTESYIHLQRQDWFGCSCCPPNIARLLASLPLYMYSASDRVVAIHLYASSEMEVEMKGVTVRLSQKTDYPWKGDVRLRIDPDQVKHWGLVLRIPGWCRRVEAKINGERTKLVIRKGYATIRRKWSPGDEITLSLDMPVERIEAHPKVRQDAGRIALQRGPVVYCLEEVDNGSDLNDIRLPRDAQLRVQWDQGLFGGTPVIWGKGERRDSRKWDGQLYSSKPSRIRPCRIQAIPYYLWANRGLGEMLVWIRE
ncbi:glycoside hydrolase family 127 protein [bacterium]|nr:glycoside hydrolase family 127 protein [bacterium]